MPPSTRRGWITRCRGLAAAKGLVKVRGTVEAPQLLADITARGLRWQELSVAQVRVEGDIKSTDQIAGNSTYALSKFRSRM